MQMDPSTNCNVSFNPLTKSLLSLPSVSAVLLLLTVTLPVPAAGQALIKSDRVEVLADDVRAAAQRTPEASRVGIFSRSENVQRQAEDLFIRRALADQAVQEGIDKDPLVAAQLLQLRDRLLSELRLERLDRSVTPPQAELARYAAELYRSDPSKYKTGEQVRASHILIMRTEQGDPREKAVALLKQLKAGAAFEELARANSADQGSARAGGDLGWFAPTTMVKEFQQALAKLKEPGELSDVVETQFGFHIIRMQGHRPAGQRSFEEVREDIERDLILRNRNEARRELARKLLAEGKPDEAAISEVAKSFAKP